MPISRVPTADEFRTALFALLPLPDAYLKCLSAHYHSPAHTATVAEIASRIGWQGGVNLHYGNFVVALGNKMGYPQEELTDLTLVGKFARRGSANGHTPLTMHPELVQAIRELEIA